MDSLILGKIDKIEKIMAQILKNNNADNHLDLKFGKISLGYESLSRIKQSLQDMAYNGSSVNDVLRDLAESPSFNAMPSSAYCNKKREIVLEYFKNDPDKLWS